MMVLDASAVLALVLREPGTERVVEHLADGHVSAVNASEVVQKVRQHGGDGPGALVALEGLGVTVEPATRQDALTAATMYASTRPYGLSTADRFCLALAKRLGVPACTADTAWVPAAYALGIELQLVR